MQTENSEQSWNYDINQIKAMERAVERERKKEERRKEQERKKEERRKEQERKKIERREEQERKKVELIEEQVRKRLIREFWRNKERPYKLRKKAEVNGGRGGELVANRASGSRVENSEDDNVSDYEIESENELESENESESDYEIESENEPESENGSEFEYGFENEDLKQPYRPGSTYCQNCQIAQLQDELRRAKEAYQKERELLGFR